MKLKFLGGCNEVGRSAILVDDTILIDYGMKPSDPPGLPLEVEGTVPKSVIVSHAHLDHSGMVPSLMDRGKAPEVYMTSVTTDLTLLLGRDTIKVGKEEGYLFFTEEHVQRMVERTHAVAYGERLTLNGSDYECELHNAGHIPGSSSVYLRKESEDVSLFYTGDIKMGVTRLMESASPADFPPSDILLIESTYFNREHRDRVEQEREFIDSIRETIDSGGNAIVPCFAIGRTQEIVMILHSYGLTPYVDGMGLTVFNLFRNYPAFLKDADAMNDAFDGAQFVNSRSRKKALAEPSVIVTTAGMLNGGPVLYYLKKIHGDPRGKVLLTGYQIEGTNGRRLLEEGCVETNGELVKVSAGVEQYDFSAHAGDSELKELVAQFCKRGTEVVFMVHGEHTEEFAAWTRDNFGCEAIAPSLGEEFIIE
ncbi:MAG: MBL fold metallo-hydrolase [Methanophagales archaeon ANME-1-THS]|nr:MAG: MBL fold metallo-hydrolase [Methanophagales archaeon ANME-1-THS]